MTILVTGPNGFVGSALTDALGASGYNVKRGLRRLAPQPASHNWSDVVVGDINGETDWTSTLKGVDTVVHLAARVHVMDEREADALAAFWAVNVEGTERLARQAAEAGVNRLVYLSSIKVNGESTEYDHQGRNLAFSERDVPVPQDPYGVSKWEAEQALHRVSEEAGIEVVVVRPPLVYGPGVKANFSRLLHWVDKGIPLPLARVDNRRSLLALDNLVDFLVRCVDHPAAAGETFLVADGEDLSTPELIRKIAAQMGRPARLAPFPSGLMRLVARLLGKGAVVNRLCGSLQVDIGKARQVLGWKPPVSVDEGLNKTVAWYMREKEGRNA